MHYQTFTVTSTHTTLAAAVEASGIDLEYNRAAAMQKIGWIDSGWNGRDNKPSATLVVDYNGKPTPFTIVEHDGIRFLNEFNPFISCMHDGPLFLWIYDSKGGKLHRTEVNFKKDKQGRQLAREVSEISTCNLLGD